MTKLTVKTEVITYDASNVTGQTIAVDGGMLLS